MTDKRVSDKRLVELMEWIEDRYQYGNASAKRIAWDLDAALLELKRRREKDKAKEEQ